MTRWRHVVMFAVIALAALAGAACMEDAGIDIGIPASGSRWTGPGTGPGVVVGGGPVY